MRISRHVLRLAGALPGKCLGRETTYGIKDGQPKLLRILKLNPELSSAL